MSEAKEVFSFYLKLVVRVGIVGVDEVVGGEGVRADRRTTGIQGFLQEEGEGEEGGGVGRRRREGEEEGGRGGGRRERQEGKEEEGRRRRKRQEGEKEDGRKGRG